MPLKGKNSRIFKYIYYTINKLDWSDPAFFHYLNAKPITQNRPSALCADRPPYIFPLDSMPHNRYVSQYDPKKIIDVQFYMSDQGNMPVKEWLKKLTPADRKTIGDDIRTVELGWPIGMPLVRKLDTGLWEVRSDLSNSRISRVLFTVSGHMMILLHGFIKKSPKTSQNDLRTARQRMSHFEKEKSNE